MLISGGGSALLPAPALGLTLADKAEVNRLLLASGADITEMNLIRQQLSRLKGGGLLRAAAPARVTALILSDVAGDDLRVIASGPTVAPIGTAAEARAALVARGVWDRLPDAVRLHLERAPEPAPLPEAENRLIGSNAISVAAMAEAAPGARVVEAPLVGDVADAAVGIWDTASGPGIWLFGGETTVVLRGEGLGGRNQELALRVALEAEARGVAGPWVFLSGGTDGRDGPTEAAGGIVDPGSLGRMRAAGVDPAEYLARNDSNAALAASGDLLVTGATGTNVADLQVLIRG
jgi:hydroxypyruvate reductase